MARLYTSGFELAAVTNATQDKEWHSGSTGQSAVTSPVRSGTYSLKIDGSAGAQQIWHQFAAANNNGPFWARTYLRIEAYPSAKNSLAELDSSSGAVFAGISIDATGQPQLYDSTGNIGSLGTALSLDTWYRIEIKVDATGGAGACVVEAKIDGTTLATSSTRTLATGICKFFHGFELEESGQTVGVWYFDDFAINDSTGSDQTSYPGSEKVIRLKPSAAGDATEWTPDSGSNFARVNEITPDDATSMVTATLTAKTDLYNVDDSGIGASDTVNVVHIGGRFRNPTTADATTSFKFEVEKTSGGTLAQSASIIPNTTTWNTNATAIPRNYPITLYKDPDSSNWTQTTLDSMQIGVLTGAIGVFGINVSTVWVTVGYTPAGAGDVSVTTSDNVAVTESVGYYSDLIAIRESYSVVIQAGNDLSVNVSDTITITESLTELVTSFINKAESITITESVTGLVTSFVNVNDTATITENVNLLNSENINVNDSITVTEIIARLVTNFINVSDNVTITESVIALLASFVNVSDTVTITENLKLLGEANISVSDTVTITESLQRMADENIRVSETVSVTENAVAYVPFYNINVSDSITISESLTVSIEGITADQVNVNDSISITESINLLIPTLFINLSDTITITENVVVSIQATATPQINVSDTITIAESVSMLVTSFINRSDSITITENALASIQGVTGLQINVNDTITITESIAALVPFYLINVNDQIGITESSSVSIETPSTVTLEIHREPDYYQDGPGVVIV